MVELDVNGKRVAADVDPETPLLWVLRDALHLTGTKYACGIGLCGACTVRLDGRPVPSCVVPVSAARGRRVVTIEGLEAPALKEAWIAEQVPQCGYCQSGMLMAAAALLEAKRAPTNADIDAAVTNLCRCGTYPRVRAAIHRAARRRTEPEPKGVPPRRR